MAFTACQKLASYDTLHFEKKGCKITDILPLHVLDLALLNLQLF